MTLSPGLRKLALTAHITSSVGWLGAVAVFLALAIAGLTTRDAGTARAAYVSMETIGWLVLVPLALTSFLTGAVQSLGTRWGFIRHYWVAFKLAITIVATAVLLLYTRTLGRLADLARGDAAMSGDLSELQSASPVLHAAAALVLLLTATTLAVYKPSGVTRYGWHKAQQRQDARG